MKIKAMNIFKEPIVAKHLYYHYDTCCYPCRQWINNIVFVCKSQLLRPVDTGIDN
jgi:hypothetical protein